MRELNQPLSLQLLCLSPKFSLHSITNWYAALHFDGCQWVDLCCIYYKRKNINFLFCLKIIIIVIYIFQNIEVYASEFVPMACHFSLFIQWSLTPFTVNLLKLLQEVDTSENSDEEEELELTQSEAIIWLAILTVWVSVLSGYLVDAIEV